jgi:cation:H+ antiporter
MMTFSTVALSILIFSGGVSRFAGLAMLITMLGYIILITKSTNNHRPPEPSDPAPKWEAKVPVVMILAFLGVPTSGYLVVTSAAALARLAGVSDWLIGATLVAAGTSLPEFVISIIAAKKGETGLGLGNIVGSNIFNILLILGSSALISPKAVSFYAVSIDLLLLIILTLWLQLSLVRGRITRLEGLGVLTLYAGYILHLTGRFPITHWPSIGWYWNT